MKELSTFTSMYLSWQHLQSILWVTLRLGLRNKLSFHSFFVFSWGNVIDLFQHLHTVALDPHLNVKNMYAPKWIQFKLELLSGFLPFASNMSGSKVLGATHIELPNVFLPISFAFGKPRCSGPHFPWSLSYLKDFEQVWERYQPWTLIIINRLKNTQSHF